VEIRGQRVLLTGASYGIGASVARVFARRGGRLGLAARSVAALGELAAEVGGVALPVDLSRPGEVNGLVDRAADVLGGPIDILINNAGMGVIGPFITRTPAEIADEVQVNLVAAIELTRQALPRMVERDHGHLVFVSSLQASAPTPAFAVYGATKAALSHFAAILRLELGSTSIGTTVVAPGPVDTPMWERVEASPFTTALLRRYSRAGLLTKGDPTVLAEQIASAVERDARHVRTPRRAVLLNLLSEAPRRMTELLLTGVPFRAESSTPTTPVSPAPDGAETPTINDR
jgi:short-subunit dehydrogenase